LWRDLPLFPPDGVYTYAPGRGHEHGHTLLGGYRGILQVDDYAVYKKLVDPFGKAGPSAQAFCGSHVRRGFYDLAKGKTAPIATEALARISALFIEAEIRGLSVAERLVHRQGPERPDRC
jgi:hypothetical protein